MLCHSFSTKWLPPFFPKHIITCSTSSSHPSGNTIILGHVLYNLPFMCDTCTVSLHLPSALYSSQGHDSINISCSENLLQKWTIVQGMWKRFRAHLWIQVAYQLFPTFSQKYLWGTLNSPLRTHKGLKKNTVNYRTKRCGLRKIPLSLQHMAELCITKTRGHEKWLKVLGNMVSDY